MKTTLTVLAVAVVFAALLALYPQALINPGPLMKGHEDLQENCLACHWPFRGVAPEKCIRCHKLEAIGKFTVAGQPIAGPTPRLDFHRQLIATDCAVCHTDHRGPEPPKATRAFSHDLLKASTLNQCESCHEPQRPDDSIHQHVASQCSPCHTPAGWKPARFDHALLASASAPGCASCHDRDRPADALHREVGQDCQQCHSTLRWKPSTFDHTRFFRFDRHHPANCADCHTTYSDFRQYTCYNCHEHRPAKVAREHREEGIFDFEDCARCHRSGDEHDIRYRGRGRGDDDREGEREYRREREDDEDEEHEHGWL